jgi:hypothetical protein
MRFFSYKRRTSQRILNQAEDFFRWGSSPLPDPQFHRINSAGRKKGIPMNPLIHLRKATQLFIVVVCFGFSPAVCAVRPPPDGGYPNANTAEGDFALFNLTTGADNPANGFSALFHNTTGNFNTATGYEALLNNATGSDNTATGVNALFDNTTGGDNTAIGFEAVELYTTCSGNTATGVNVEEQDPIIARQ